MNEEIKTKFEIELSEVKDCDLLDGRGSLFYCVIRRDGEHLYTCQARAQWIGRACWRCNCCQKILVNWN